MVVCHCRGVRDCAVRLAIEAGATDVDAVAAGCGAGARCDGCRNALAALLAEMTRRAPAAAGMAAAGTG